MSEYHKSKSLKNEHLHHKGKSIICITTGKQFDSMVEASDFYNCNPNTIALCCKGKRQSSGKLEDGTKLVWVYYNEYINMSKEQIHNKIIENNKINRNYKGREVICNTTLRKFNSCTDAFLIFKS
jgi:hypothetical protein